MTTENDDLTIREMPVGEILGGKFLVPEYQRGYRWSRDEVIELLEDIQDALNDGDDYYFIGSFNLINDNPNKPFEVVDGQQRLTTISLIAREARFLLQKETSNLGEEGVVHLMSALLKISDEVVHFDRKSEREGFEKLMKGDATSHDQMSVASKEVKEFIKRKKEETSHVGNTDELVRYMNYLLNNVKVVFIVVKDEKIAYKIFEALNLRGKPLGTIDSIRIFVFRNINREKFEYCFKLWEDLENTMRMTHKRVDDLMTQMFNTFFECHRGIRIEENHLFSKVENSFKQEAQDEKEKEKESQKIYLDFFEKIVSIDGGSKKNFPNYYLASVKHDHDLWKKLDVPIFFREALCGTKIWDGNKICRAPIAAMFHALNMPKPRITTEQANNIMHDMYSLISRLEALGILRGQNVSKCNSRLAAFAKKLIYTEENFETIAQELFQGIHDQVDGVMSDKDFRVEMTANKKVRRDKAKRLLRDIEFARNKQLANVGKEIHIEHILPQNPNEKDWKDFSVEDRDYHTNRIGNFALLLDVDNQRIGNKPFADKVLVYAENTITTTNELAKNTDWTKDDIEERSKRLAKEIAGVWNFHYYNPSP